MSARSGFGVARAAAYSFYEPSQSIAWEGTVRRSVLRSRTRGIGRSIILVSFLPDCPVARMRVTAATKHIGHFDDDNRQAEKIKKKV